MRIESLYKQERNTKFVFELQDGAFIESSLFIHQNLLHYCVPSQVGCPLRCNHCATTYSRVPYIRQLTNMELIEMVELMQENSDNIELPWVLSFSGHGEPMLNWDAVSETMEYFRGKFSVYYLTSVGIVNMFEKIQENSILPVIYFSMHGSCDEERNKIIHQKENYRIADLEQLLKFGRVYVHKGGKIVWNYMVCSFNSAEESKARLEDLIRKIDYPLEIRLTKYTDIGKKNGIKGVTDQEIEEMYERLMNVKNLMVHVRKSWLEGVEIGIACGQLRAHAEEERMIDTKE